MMIIRAIQLLAVLAAVEAFSLSSGSKANSAATQEKPNPLGAFNDPAAPLLPLQALVVGKGIQVVANIELLPSLGLCGTGHPQVPFVCRYEF